MLSRTFTCPLSKDAASAEAMLEGFDSLAVLSRYSGESRHILRGGGIVAVGWSGQSINFVNSHQSSGGDDYAED